MNNTIIMESYCNSVKWTRKEINYMIQQYFYEQVGYRAIARELNRNETHVRKQIAYLMSELVA